MHELVLRETSRPRSSPSPLPNLTHHHHPGSNTTNHITRKKPAGEDIRAHTHARARIRNTTSPGWRGRGRTKRDVSSRFGPGRRGPRGGQADRQTYTYIYLWKIEGRAGLATPETFVREPSHTKSVNLLQVDIATKGGRHRGDMIQAGRCGFLISGFSHIWFRNSR